MFRWCVWTGIAVCVALWDRSGVLVADARAEEIFVQEKLVAWCIVPFDAKQRTPDERAQMLKSLGIRRLAYDWRPEHIPTFDAEIEAMRRHEIEVSAFWLWLNDLEPGADADVALVLETLRRNQLHTQIWISFDDRQLEGLDQAQRVAAVAAAIAPIAAQAKAMKCQIGLYNHGGWFGDPLNQIEVIESLNQANVGLVFNFHHAHDQLDRFAGLLPKMLPHLLAINLNGMRREGPKILSIGEGDSERHMLQLIQASGYQGLIGILDHREGVDAQQSLSENLAGLQRIREELQASSAEGDE